MKNVPIKNRLGEMSFADLRNYQFEQLLPPYLHAET